jgi:hypothetical protein
MRGIVLLESAMWLQDIQVAEFDVRRHHESQHTSVTITIMIPYGCPLVIFLPALSLTRTYIARLSKRNQQHYFRPSHYISLLRAIHTRE